MHQLAASCRVLSQVPETQLRFVPQHDGSEYSSADDEESSLADSAFITGQYRTAAHNKYSGSQADFDRMSARLEKEMGLGTDNESLASLKVGA